MSPQERERAIQLYERSAALAQRALDQLRSGQGSGLDELFRQKRQLSAELDGLAVGLDQASEGLLAAQEAAIRAENLLSEALQTLEKSKKMGEHFNLRSLEARKPGKQVDLST